MKYRLIHGHFLIGLVIIPRPPYWPETESRSNMGRGMITRPKWKCPCIKLFITYMYLVQIKAFCMTNMNGSKTVHIFIPRENNRLLDY